MNVPVDRLLADLARNETRRQFFARGVNVVGTAAFASLVGGEASRAVASPAAVPPALTHFAPKAKRVIYLHMVGGPSQLDLYDYKPKMGEMYDKDLPESVRMGQRLTTMTSGQKRFPVAPSKYKFKQHGKSGMWVSEMLPHTAKMVDDMCFIRSMNTEAINHEPAITLMQTGNMVTGRPCLGSWASYGLGSMNENLPTFVVMVARPSNTEQIQAISARLWSSGYLPGRARRRRLPVGRRPDPLYQQPRRRHPRRPPSDPRRPQGPQRADLRPRRRPRDAHAHPAIRTRLPDAVERPRPHRPRERARHDV